MQNNNANTSSGAALSSDKGAEAAKAAEEPKNATTPAETPKEPEAPKEEPKVEETKKASSLEPFKDKIRNLSGELNAVADKVGGDIARGRAKTAVNKLNEALEEVSVAAAEDA